MGCAVLLAELGGVELVFVVEGESEQRWVEGWGKGSGACGTAVAAATHLQFALRRAVRQTAAMTAAPPFPSVQFQFASVCHLSGEQNDDQNDER